MWVICAPCPYNLTVKSMLGRIQLYVTRGFKSMLRGSQAHSDHRLARVCLPVTCSFAKIRHLVSWGQTRGFSVSAWCRYLCTSSSDNPNNRVNISSRYRCAYLRTPLKKYCQIFLGVIQVMFVLFSVITQRIGLILQLNFRCAYLCITLRNFGKYLSSKCNLELCFEHFIRLGKS